MPKIDKKLASKPEKVKIKKKSVKPTKSALIKPRSIRSKDNTLSYYHCLIDQVANPLNEKVKITQMSHHCRCNKGKAEVARTEHKQQLVKKLAQSYKDFGRSLGHYLHADIVGCAKGLKK